MNLHNSPCVWVSPKILNSQKLKFLRPIEGKKFDYSNSVGHPFYQFHIVDI